MNAKLLLIATLACCGAVAHGQQQPQQIAPRKIVAAAGFTLQRVVFRGNSRLDDAALGALAAGYIGREVTLAELERLAAAVTQAYRERGYFLAQALVPQQEVKDGTVEISVLEGRIGKVRLSVAADAPIGESRVRGFLVALPEGTVLQQSRYERTMLLLSDLPGLHVQSGLEQGAETGTTDLVVEVGPAARRWQASAALDNYGSAVSGRERLSVSARWLSPLSIGDNLDARLMRTFNGGQTFGRLAYELPLGGGGLRGGAGYARVGYDLGAQFAALGASGTAKVSDLSLSYPILRSRTKNLFARVSYEHKALSDTTEAIGLQTDKTANGANVALNWESRDAWLGGGYVSAGMNLLRGRLAIDDAASADQDQSDFGYHTRGNYTKLTLQGSRLQTLFRHHNLYASLAGQWSSRNLDASEKLALGGDRAVRAYPSGEVLVDEGLVGSIEWRYSVNDDLVFALFHDVGHGKLWRDPLPTDTRNRRTLRGSGLSVSWNAPYGCTLLGSVAWRNGDAPVSETGNDAPRVLVQLQKTF